MATSKFDYLIIIIRSSNWISRTPLHTLSFWASVLTFNQKLPALDICRSLVDAGAIDALIDDVSVIARKNIPKAFLRYIQQQMHPPYHDIPLSKRFEIASRLRPGNWKNVPDLIRMTLGKNLNREVVNYTDASGKTLLHHISRRLGNANFLQNSVHAHSDNDEGCNSDEWNKALEPESHRNPWRILLRDVVAAGSPLHVMDNHGRTPLCRLIQEAIFSLSKQYFHKFRSLLKILNVWLIELYKCGVDLQQYGDIEAALRLQDHANRSPRSNLCLYVFISKHMLTARSRALPRFRISKLLGFCHGPTPQDWHFWFREPTDVFVGPFLAAVTDEPGCSQGSPLEEFGQPIIPGAWIESLTLQDIGEKSDSEPYSGSEADSGPDNDPDYSDDLNFDVQNTSPEKLNFYIQIPTAFPLADKSVYLLSIRGGSRDRVNFGSGELWWPDGFTSNDLLS